MPAGMPPERHEVMVGIYEPIAPSHEPPLTTFGRSFVAGVLALVTKQNMTGQSASTNYPISIYEEVADMIPFSWGIFDSICFVWGAR